MSRFLRKHALHLKSTAKTLRGDARNHIAVTMPIVSIRCRSSKRTPLSSILCNSSLRRHSAPKPSACQVCRLRATSIVTSRTDFEDGNSVSDNTVTLYCHQCHEAYLSAKEKVERERKDRLAVQHAKVKTLLSDVASLKIHPRETIPLDHAVEVLISTILSTGEDLRKPREWYRRQLVDHLSKELLIMDDCCSRQRVEAMNFKAWCFRDRLS